MDLMAKGLDWFAGKMKEFLSRSVTYRGVRDGNPASAIVFAGLGTSQVAPINTLGTEQTFTDLTRQNPSEIDRDYIVAPEDLRAAGLWPPQSADFIDDNNDEDGANRYQVKSVPAQASWRPLRGSYMKLVRIHTKFYSRLATYWADTFTGADGTLLPAHAPEVGVGGYASGDGIVSLLGNRIVASTPTAFHYFAPGQQTAVSRISFSLNGIILPVGQYVELGLGVRCDSAGAGQRDGYYCTVKVTAQTAVLRMTRQNGVANNVIDSLALKNPLALTATYKLAVSNGAKRVTCTLIDPAGSMPGSVGIDSTLEASNTGQAVFFQHHAAIADPKIPWMDGLTVEAE
jgi:hypothetical protein